MHYKFLIYILICLGRSFSKNSDTHTKRRRYAKMFVFLALIIIVITSIYIWQKRVYSFWAEKGIPQQKPTFPMGTMRTDQNYAYTFDEAYKMYKGKSKYIGIYFGLQPTLLVIDEEAIKQIMVKDFQYNQSRGIYHNEKNDPLSAHLFSIEGHKWRGLRAKLTPTFTSGKMKSMFPIVVDIGQKLKEVMDAQVHSGEKGIDMREMFARFTTDVIGNCAFGLECNSLQDPKAKFRQMGVKLFGEPRHSPAVQFLIVGFPNISRKLGMKITQDDVEEFFLKAVNDTVELRSRSNIKRNDFMDLLIALRNKNKSNSLEDSLMDGLSMNEIAANCFVFFLAGFETSSTVSSFTIYELSKNQEIQEKLRNHIQDVLSKHDDEITYESLKEMTYLDQCINEGMRKYPPVGMLNRQTVQPYKIPFSDVVVPKDTLIMIPVYSIHNDPNNYPEPEKYDPDRFTPEQIAKRHPFSYLPFGEGPRNCIGERFGMMQAKIGLVYLIKSYRFKLSPNTKPITFKKDAFILTAENGLFFDVEAV